LEQANSHYTRYSQGGTKDGNAFAPASGNFVALQHH